MCYRKESKLLSYADDLIMWCSKEEYPSMAIYRMQQALNNLKGMTDKWCVTINKENPGTTLFTYPPSIRHVL